MTQKTLLTLEEAQPLLHAFHLKARELLPLHAGTINSNYRVLTDVGPLFLRINEGKREEDVRFEADLIWHLNTRAFPTPAVWRTRRGDPFARLPSQPGKLATLMQWVDGEERPEDALCDAACASVGDLLGRLHQATLDFRGGRPGIYTLAQITRRVQQLHQEPRIPDGLVEHLERQAERLQREQAAPLPGTCGLGHTDLFPDNLFFARGGPATWVLDLEQAATVPYLYDVAVTLLSFCAPPQPPKDAALLGPLVQTRARALWTAYAARFPAARRGDDAATAAALHRELRFAALRFTVTRLTDIHLPRLRGAPPLATRHSKDYRDFLGRLTALEEPSVGPGLVELVRG